MNRWQVQNEGRAHDPFGFFSKLQKEEHEKAVRLADLGRSIGLPVYPTVFVAASDREGLVTRIQELVEGGKWDLAVKITDETGEAVYRRLGILMEDAIAAADAAPPGSLVSLMPYREPDVSGIIWKRPEQLLVELVKGPHFWITKWAPPGVQVMLGRASPISPILEFSPDPFSAERELFARVTRTALRHLFGRGLQAVLALDVKVYAEFHWFHVGGARFIECSFSDAWTG
jgi:hypothetical protein